MKATPRVPYICRLRIDTPAGNHGCRRHRPEEGWQAKNRRLGFSQFFNVRKYGGVTRALRRAERFVRAELRERGIPIS